VNYEADKLVSEYDTAPFFIFFISGLRIHDEIVLSPLVFGQGSIPEVQQDCMANLYAIFHGSFIVQIFILTYS
jgi:hypothetical protein